MPGGNLFAAALPFVAILLASGVWANRRYARFDKLPSHFGITGQADAFAPRRTMVWLLPVLFAFVLVALAVLMAMLPPEQQNGDPLVGILVGGVALLSAQLLVLWLTERWARQQPPA